ncbi:MAG: YdcF family protein [Streptococcaceae bacterium]|jgi:uncharacterized SAM-binding protein YcdF (DUF218 family)|nr:YdcF family protein [Streptococcaceae bacterium]
MKRRVLKILAAIVVLGLVWCGVCLHAIYSETGSHVSGQVGSILVEGAQVLGTAEKPYPSPQLKVRLDAALTLHKEFPEAKLVVSGAKGSDEPVAEGDAMADYLEAHGVAPQEIVRETRAKDTFQNLVNSKKYLTGRVALVTNDFHMYRSLYLAKKAGLQDVTGDAVKTPVTGPLNWVAYYGHEVMGVTWAWIFGGG